ncbi:MAG: T9SS type A sorting domain-containing protein [Bacteroidales bacterium]|nr:T9SS type A sorting domain-containing protein [Bacteroidales bacterium]
MKTKLIIAILIFFEFSGFSQSPYYPLIDTGKTWHVMEAFFPGPTLTYIYKCDEDTVINNEIYKILYSSMEEFPASWIKMGFLREDSSRKVFYSPLSSLDFEPALVYDFNVEAGDTITITSFFQSYPYEVEFVVTTVDSILINGDYRRRINLSCEYYGQNFWIEGIGSNNGLLETGFYCYIVCPTIELLCVQKQGEILYQNEYFNDCYIVGIEENVASVQPFKVFPNPATHQVSIVAMNGHKGKYIFHLQNSIGQEIINIEMNDSETPVIDVSTLTAGIYFYTLGNDNKIEQSGKLLIRR